MSWTARLPAPRGARLQQLLADANGSVAHPEAQQRIVQIFATARGACSRRQLDRSPANPGAHFALPRPPVVVLLRS